MVSFQCFFMTQDTHQGKESVPLQATLQVVGGWKFQEPETFCYYSHYALLLGRSPDIHALGSSHGCL